jgi:putative transposase
LASAGEAGLLSKRNGKPSKKGTGFEQPLAAHQHWHIDVSYINISGTFHYLCSILDGCSRYIVNWDLLESMTKADIEVMLQRRRGTSSEGATPDDLRQRTAVHRQGLQGVHSDLGHAHVRTSPYYPQSNGITRNNGITEGFHTKMEVFQRQAYGFRNFQNYRLRVRVMCF